MRSCGKRFDRNDGVSLQGTKLGADRRFLAGRLTTTDIVTAKGSFRDFDQPIVRTSFLHMVAFKNILGVSSYYPGVVNAIGEKKFNKRSDRVLEERPCFVDAINSCLWAMEPVRIQLGRDIR